MRERIAYLFTAYPLWSETFLRQDLSLLQRQGLNLVPLALFSGNCQRQNDWPTVTVLSPADSPQPPVSQPRFWKHWLPRSLRGPLSLLVHRRLRTKLCEALRTAEVTHLHAEFAGLGALLGAQAACDLGLTFSVGIHANDIHCLQYSPARLFGGANLVLSCNQAALRAFHQLPSVSDVPAVYMPHGLDLSRWPWQETMRLAEPRQPRRLLFAGRLVPKKGLDSLLRALALVIADGQDWSLTVAGDGPMATSWRHLAAELDLADRVHWRGVLTQSQLLEELRQADIFCLPARRLPNAEQDGLPNVLLEAAAVGLPIVSSQVGSISDFLSSETGWALPSMTPEALATTLREMLHAPDETDRRRRQARRLLERDFDADELAVQRAKLILAAVKGAPFAHILS